MTIYIYLPLLVAILGLIMYLTIANPAFAKFVEVGRIMFWVGLLAFLLEHH